MLMQAVLFVPENFPLILERMGIPKDMELRVKDTSRDFSENFYFIPEYITKEGRPYGSWCALGQKAMDEEFDYDKEMIKSQFVDISRK